MLGSPVERAKSSGLSGTENQTPMILNCSIRCLAMASSSKAVVRHICGRVTNLIYNTGLSGDRFLVFTWGNTRRICVFRTDFYEKTAEVSIKKRSL